MYLYIAGYSFLILANMYLIANRNVVGFIFLVMSVISFLLSFSY